MKRFLLNTLRSPVFQACSIAFVLLLIFYGKILLHPGSYLLSVSPDGIKGYYAYAWQINYGTHPFEFSGMNYPVGEHVLYADAHTPLTWLSWILPFIKNFPVETINLCILLGFLLTAGVVCRLLQEWGATQVFAVLGAVVITFLSPIVMRITGHFSLSYGFVIPLGLLWWTRFLKTGEYFRYSWKIGLLVLCFLLTHAYPAIMLAMFIFISACCFGVYSRHDRKKITYWLFTICATLLPIIVFKLFMSLTDGHTGRPETPTGFFENFAAWKGIFLPVSGFFSEWIKTKADLSVVSWEKWAYLGTATLVSCTLGALFLFIPKAVSSAADRKKISFLLFIIPAVLLLVFAAGFPFRLYPQTADWISFIKQFRVLARFAWPFYFVAGMYAVLWVQHVWNKERVYVFVKYGLVSVVLVLSALDIYSYNRMVQQWTGDNSNVFDREQLDAELNKAIDVVKKENPDFLICLPYFHVGSEMYNRGGTNKSRQAAFTFSFHSGKPLLNVEMSRSSVTETERLFDMFAPRYALSEKNKNFLKGKVVLVDTKEGTTFREKELLKNCKLVYAGENLDVYVAESKNIFTPRPLQDTRPLTVLLVNSGHHDSTCTAHAFDYNDLPGKVLEAPMRKYTVLDTFIAGELKPDLLYHISFHFKTKKGSRKGGMFVVQTVDKKGNIDWVEVVNLAQGGMSYNGKIIFEHGFIARTPEKRYQVFVYDGLGTYDNYVIDNYLFRSNSVNVGSPESGLLNNYPLLRK
ncbi:MAG: hypothetical protein ACHQF2_04825 [Flavobacteriales bacterium]